MFFEVVLGERREFIQDGEIIMFGSFLCRFYC